MENVFDESWQESIGIRLFAAGAVVLGDWWRFQLPRARFWRLYANNRDGAVMRLKNGSFPLHGGRISIFPPGHAYSTFSIEGVEHFYAHFDVSGLPDIALRRLFRHPFYLPESQPLFAIAQDAARQLRDQPAGLA
jgi:hypothetical protein